MGCHGARPTVCSRCLLSTFRRSTLSGAQRPRRPLFLPQCPTRLTHMNFGFAELHGGGTRVRIVPALGGKIISFESLGREWLWSDPATPAREGAAPAWFAEAGYTGGYDECFPTTARSEE